MTSLFPQKISLWCKRRVIHPKQHYFRGNIFADSILKVISSQWVVNLSFDNWECHILCYVSHR